MCDVSYTFRSNKIILNKFFRIRTDDATNWDEKEHILRDLNKYESEEILGDFIEMRSDLPGPTLEELSDMSCEDIIAALMNLKCSWGIIYYNSRLGKVFIGRDIFGRQSILFTTDSSSITISYLGRPTTVKWNEIPYAQVSVFDAHDIFSSLQLCSYVHEYPDELDLVWKSLFSTVHRQINHTKDKLITVSRSLLPSTSHEGLRHHLISAMISLLPPSIDSVGVCFSGGVDSLLISHLLLSILPTSLPIHLINVAFGDDPLFISRASDRFRSIEAYSFLKEQFLQHDIHLILVDVTAESLRAARSILIPLATRPSSTVLGIGTDFDTKKEIRCSSSIRLMGSGADELFAGYARHRHRYERDGNSSGIAEECELELRRLGVRNGGRDARVALVNGIEIKSPFLHDDLVEWANGLSIEEKADLSLPRGIGEKKIIRECLRSMNVPHCAPKQAMQFGSGMVKMENRKNQKGSHKSTHLEM